MSTEETTEETTEEKVKETFYSDILQFVRDNPGTPGSAIQKHFNPRPQQTISSALGRFRRMGLITQRGSYWYPIDPGQIAPEFTVMAGVFLSELNSMTPESRENHLARRLQEEFQKNIGISDEEIVQDEDIWFVIQQRRKEIRDNHAARNDAAVLFGEDTIKDWTMDELKLRLAEVYNRWWKQSGGEGPHPMSPKIKN